MSGICGIVFSDVHNRLENRKFLPMIRALDIAGEGKEDLVVNFGFAGIGAQSFSKRLAGVTALNMEEGASGIAFHGSLYNLAELSESNGKQSDPCTELLTLYLREGISFLQRLRGDFVIAIWDGLTATLYLATDRFRVHPIFYYKDQEKIIFSSRIKSILACPLAMTLTIEPTAIVDVVGTSIIPTPKTIYREIQKLPPGHYLSYDRKKIEIKPYWEITYLHPSTEDETVLARQFRDHFTTAISDHLKVDDNPNRIGTFLSGGIDSSTVTGVVTELVRHPIKSFSIGFEEERFNEINYSRIAAQAFGADHYEYFVTSADTIDIIPKLMDSMDEPYGNASAVPAYFCAKLAKDNGVDILYAGDGGDELFAGNERYTTQRLFEYYYYLPKWFRDFLLRPVVFAVADKMNWELFIKGKKYILRACMPYHERISSYDFFKVESIREFISDDMLSEIGFDYNPYKSISLYYYEAPAKQDLDRHLFIDWKLTISDNDLFKFRMAEAAGVLVRFPFLDDRLAEFANKVPAGIKMRGTRLRSFQKKAYKELLPKVIRKKKKHGFGLPISEWLRNDKRLNELMLDLVLSSQSVQRGYFKKKALQKLVEHHIVDKTSFYGTILWNLMILELWHRKYLNYNL